MFAEVDGIGNDLVLREREITAADPFPGRADVDVELHGERVVAQGIADGRARHGAAAEGEHGGPLVLECRDGGFGLQHAELRLTPLLEQLGDRLPCRAGQLVVEVDEAPAEPLRDLPAEGRLARAHEADERDVPV